MSVRARARACVFVCLCEGLRLCAFGPDRTFAVKLRPAGTRAPLERTARVPCSRHGRVPLSTLDGVPLESPSNPPRVPREYPLSTLQPCRVPGEYPPGAKSTCASSSPAGSRACSTACCRPRCEIPENLPTKRGVPSLAPRAPSMPRENPLVSCEILLLACEGPVSACAALLITARGAINNRAIIRPHRRAPPAASTLATTAAAAAGGVLRVGRPLGGVALARGGVALARGGVALARGGVALARGGVALARGGVALVRRWCSPSGTSSS
jgi:hypothetical protein